MRMRKRRRGHRVDSIAVARNACPARARRAKKVRARIGSVPVSLREDAPNGTQRRITCTLTTLDTAPRKSLNRRLGR
ncbi:hypothetical protein DIE14_14260 [Burkholderia sp. Bp9017]|nr:hypothetical protein DIE14_14260 [Burkholderia sp. Bp9017]RQZ34202.1 hypothetical protein DIE13_14170 [Burkholderia sp. Bp9016]